MKALRKLITCFVIISTAIILNTNTSAATAPATYWFDGKEYRVTTIDNTIFMIRYYDAVPNATINGDYVNGINTGGSPPKHNSTVYWFPLGWPVNNGRYLPYDGTFQGALPRFGQINQRSGYSNGGMLATVTILRQGERGTVNFPVASENWGSPNQLITTQRYCGVDVVTRTLVARSSDEESGDYIAEAQNFIDNIRDLVYNQGAVFRFNYNSYRGAYEYHSIMVAKDWDTFLAATSGYGNPTVSTWQDNTTNTVHVSATGAAGTTSIALIRNGTLVNTVWAASANFATNLNGNYIIRCSNGTQTKDYTFSVTGLDNAAPTASYSAISAGWERFKTTTLYMSDGTTTGLQYKHNGEWKSYTGPATLSFTSAGTFIIELKDRWGNTSSISITVSNIDGTAPVIVDVSGNPTQWVKNGEAKLTILATDSQSGLHAQPYSFDNGLTWTSNNQLVLNSNQTLSITVRDIAGNIASPRVIVVNRVDSSLPIIHEITGNSVTWIGQDVELRINASDNMSGLHAQPYSFDDGATWQAQPTKFISSNQSLIVRVRDVVGFEVSQAVNISCIDKTKPDISHIIVPSVTDKATINLTMTDTGSGLRELELPGGQKVALTGTYQTYSHEVTTNGSYRFIVKDAINSQELVVNVTEITYNGDISVDIKVTYGSTTEISENVTSDFRVQLPIADTAGTITLTTRNPYTKILNLHDQSINSSIASLSFDLTTNNRIAYSVKTVARNGSQAEFSIILSTENSKPIVKQILNNSDRVFGGEGSIDNLSKVYTKYESEPGQDGILIELTVQEPNKGQWVKGSAKFESITFPIHWNTVNGPYEITSTGIDVKGYINIPGHLIKTSSSRNPIEIKIVDMLSAGDAAYSETLARTEVATDISGPSILLRCDDLLQLDVIISDETGVESIKVQISEDNGSTWQEYTDRLQFFLEDSKTYTIKVSAKDYLFNGSNVERIIGDSETQLDLTKPIEGVDNNTSVYYYKTRNARFYLINGSEENATTIPADNFLFIDRVFK